MLNLNLSKCIILSAAAASVSTVVVTKAFAFSTVSPSRISRTHANANANANYGEPSIESNPANTYTPSSRSIRVPLSLHMSAIEKPREDVGIEFDFEPSQNSKPQRVPSLPSISRSINTNSGKTNTNRIRSRASRAVTGRSTNKNIASNKPSMSMPMPMPSIEILSTASRRRNRNTKPKKYAKRNDSERLTREEEITLTRSIGEMKSLIRIHDDLSKVKTSLMQQPLVPNKMYKEKSDVEITLLPFENKPSEEEWAEACNLSVIQLRRKLIAGREARSRLVAANIGLVFQIAKRYDSELQRSIEGGGGNGVGTILTLNDFVQEGNLGLMEAAERFESDKGARFSTYASYWVKHRIIRAITNHSRVIRLPAHVHHTLRTVRKASADMEKEIGRAPSMPELAHKLEIPIEKLRLYTDSSRSVISLNSPLNGGSGGGSGKSGSGDEDKRTVGDKIASDGPTPEEDAEFGALQRDIREAIDGLGSDRERDVLLYRFGLDDGDPCTLEETGKRLGISRESVRVIENRALNKLRHPQRNYRLKEYIGHPCPSEDDGQEIDLFDNGHRHGNGHGHGHHRRKNDDRNNNDDTLSQFRPEQIWSF